ncbi:MAG: aldehyde dehydrogenase family protein [Dongiaceae bacterium]
MHAFDPERVEIRGGYYLDGSCHDGTGEEIAVARPSDSRVYARLAGCTAAEVDRAVESSLRAFRTSGWATRAPRERARVLRRWADLVEADAERLAPLEAVGSTRPHRDVAGFDLAYTADGIRFFAELADKVGGAVPPTRADDLGLIVPEPYGVVAAIAPWNFPLIMASWKFAPALAAGNAVVLKPSELTPFSVLRLAELGSQAGLPDGILNIVQGRGATVGEALCRHPGVAKITFTGSTATGRAIMVAAAESGIKPVTLELGGKSPQIVFARVPDLERTAGAIVRGITANAGQVCVAGSRLIVHESIADDLVERIARAFRALRPGATWDAEATMPPLISDAHAGKVDDIVRRSLAAGADAIVGGRRPETPRDGAYYLPTILGRVTPQSAAVREEIFGPVLTLQTFADEEEALALANDSAYGLAAGVHTTDFAQALRALRRLEAGTVWINRYGRSLDFVLPTGGYKQSGIGKDLGLAAYEANLRFKQNNLADLAPRPAATAGGRRLEAGARQLRAGAEAGDRGLEVAPELPAEARARQGGVGRQHDLLRDHRPEGPHRQVRLPVQGTSPSTSATPSPRCTSGSAAIDSVISICARRASPASRKAWSSRRPITGFEP